LVGRADLVWATVSRTGEQGVDLVDGMICDPPENVGEIGLGKPCHQWVSIKSDCTDAHGRL
jgi:hypothetical protein